MATDKKQESELLEQELFADLQMDSLESAQSADETPKESLADLKEQRKAREAQSKRDDKWVVILMIIASVLCMGIIGYLIYWLEVFLK